jgi:hypothetical protein
MGRFRYSDDNEHLVRGGNLDPIIHSAKLEVESATVTDTGDVEYILTLTDKNLLEGSITFSLVVAKPQESRVTSVTKVQKPAISNPPEQAEATVWTVLGNNDLDELCYGIQIKDIPQRLGRSIIEFDLNIDAANHLDFTHRWYDIPLEEGTEN